MKAACSGCSCSGVPMPSIVVTSASLNDAASARHEAMRRPATSTVQAPQPPMSQPFFVPVMPSWSRITSSSDASGAISRSWRVVLMVMESAMGVLADRASSLVIVAALLKQSFDYDRFTGLLKAWYYPRTGGYLLHFLRLVMAGHSRSKNGVASRAYGPGHPRV